MHQGNKNYQKEYFLFNAFCLQNKMSTALPTKNSSTVCQLECVNALPKHNITWHVNGLLACPSLLPNLPSKPLIFQFCAYMLHLPRLICVQLNGCKTNVRPCSIPVYCTESARNRGLKGHTTLFFPWGSEQVNLALPAQDKRR